MREAPPTSTSRGCPSESERVWETRRSFGRESRDEGRCYMGEREGHFFGRDDDFLAING